MNRLPGGPVLDSFTLSGAEEIASRIRRYWLVRGYDVDVRVERTKTSGGGTVACVRSNLVNGLPRSKILAVAA